MSQFKKWHREHRQALIGGWVTLAVLVVWMLFMDWIVMPLYTNHGREVELPDITEHSFDEAQKILESGGFKLIKDREKSDANYPKGTVIFQNPQPYAKVKKGRRIYVTVSSGEKAVLVPQIVGRSERDAAFDLSHAGLVLGKVSYEFNDYYPPGVVCDQSVAADGEVGAKTIVDIKVSRGTLPSRFVVPRVTGKNIETAKKLLWEAGLEVGFITNEIQTDLVPGTVLSQSVEPGTEVTQGRAVGLTISRVE
jgi:eukaryotic-like serine/threonine-protein kinase